MADRGFIRNDELHCMEEVEVIYSKNQNQDQNENEKSKTITENAINETTKNHRDVEWTGQNTETIIRWQKDLEVLAYIYQDQSNYYASYIKHVLILSVIGSTIVAIMSTVNAANGIQLSGTYIILYNVVIAVIATLIGTINTLIPMFNWDNKFQDYKDYSDDLIRLWTSIELELNMAEKHRIDSDDYVKRIFGQYLTLKQQAPDMKDIDAETSQKKFKNKLYDNLLWEQKFKKKMEELIVK